MTTLVCWRCGTSLSTIPLPMARLAQCKQCSADLHVCRLCHYYNPRLSDKCDHEMAEPAREVDVANFCHYFKPRSDAYASDDKQRADKAMNQLKTLFGDKTSTDTRTSDTSADDTDKARFDALFKKD